MKCLILAVVVLLACVGKTHAASAEVDIGLGYSHLSLDGSERFKDRDGVRVEPRISFAPSESRPELRLGFGLGISGYSHELDENTIITIDNGNDVEVLEADQW